MKIETKAKGFTIRTTTVKDVPLIMEFVRDLAAYEKLSHEFTATAKDIETSLFKKKVAEAVIGEYDGKPVGFAIFFLNFSSFVGKPGMYLEDLFVKPEYRKRGFGRALLTYVGKVAKERDCGRYEWSVLNWNEPAILFYQSLGAEFMEEWTVMRATGHALDYIADKF